MNQPSLLPLLRRAAPRLSRHFFPGPQCLHNTRTTTGKVRIHSTGSRIESIHKSTRQTPFLKAFRSGSRSQSTAAPSISEIGSRQSGGHGILGNLRRKAAQEGKTADGSGAKKREGFFPAISDKTVAYWLLASAASVYGMVVLGGLTRLTESGYVFQFNSCRRQSFIIPVMLKRFEDSA